MQDAFEDRERSEEAKYKLDEELQFKMRCRRNKMAARWAAGRMGLSGTRADAYVSDLIGLALSTPEARAAVARIEADFGTSGARAAPGEIAATVAQFQDDALASLLRDFPEALDRDHVQIGG